MIVRVLVSAVLVAGLSTASARACDAAGVVTRIDGRPQDVIIQRADRGGAADARPRILDALCTGDRIEVKAGAKVRLSLDGVGLINLDSAKPYIVPRRAAAPSVAGNAYRMLADMVMPDMKRLAWDVRLRGEVTPFGLSAPVKSGAALAPGRSSLLFRLQGGVGPFTAELRDGAGVTLGRASSATRDVPMTLAGGLQPGLLRLTLRDSSGAVSELGLSVRAPPPVSDLSDVSDPEVRATLGAIELARADAGLWALEAQQMVAAAPVQGLDRDRVFQLIDSYGED